MPVTGHRSIVGPARAGERLDGYLAVWLSSRLGVELTRSAIRRLIMAGAVSVEGRPARRPGLALRDGWRVEARVDLDRLVGASNATGPPRGGDPAGPIESPGIETLYRDAFLLAVDKPAGLLVHPSADRRRPDLFSSLLAMLAAERAGGGESAAAPYLGLHHRLDVGTSGVMLFTLDEAANAGLARAFAAHEVEKTYHALVGLSKRRVPDGWTERAPLAPTGSGRRARMSPADSDGLTAETAFAVVRRLGRAALVEARPRTGRKHQVRAHLASRGLPILGDLRYGGAAAVGGVAVPRVMLHARRLRLRHPVTGVALDIRCPYPADFRDLLSRLSSRSPGSLDTPGTSR